MRNVKKDSATMKILLALVPYTRENLLLAFEPSRFFYELEKSTNHSSHTLRTAYRRAQKNDLIQLQDGKVDFSLQARRAVQPFIAQKLDRNGQLMVIFDIPETHAQIRRDLRLLLLELKFRQIQKSVWVTDMDCSQLVRDYVRSLHVQDWVKLYEAAPIT